jgi:hypothetical protein
MCRRIDPPGSRHPVTADPLCIWPPGPWKLEAENWKLGVPTAAQFPASSFRFPEGMEVRRLVKADGGPECRSGERGFGPRPPPASHPRRPPLTRVTFPARPNHSSRVPRPQRMPSRPSHISPAILDSLEGSVYEGHSYSADSTHGRASGLILDDGRTWPDRQVPDQGGC